MSREQSSSGLQAAHLNVEAVTKRFGAATAVDRVTLQIPRGAFATLLGPSGCGKTTLLRVIAGFYEPDEGALYLDDERIDQLPAHRRGTAMVFQDYALFPHMRVRDNVAYGLRLAKQPKNEITQRVAETLEFVGLTGLADRWPNQLSGGQQQRVALARALIVQPKVLLLDEPLSNLDANLRERMRWELRALQQRLNITFLYVTHDQSEALAMSDWVAVMNSGRVEQWGSPWEIYYHPRTAFMADFVGSANLLPAMVTKRSGETATVSMGEHTLSVAASGVSGEKILLCIRPETLGIGTTPKDASCISLPGTVTRYAFLGNQMRYWVQIDGKEWIIDQNDPGTSARVFDGPVIVSVDPARVHVINTA